MTLLKKVVGKDVVAWTVEGLFIEIVSGIEIRSIRVTSIQRIKT